LKNLLVGVVVIAVLALGTFLLIQSKNFKNNSEKKVSVSQNSNNVTDSNKSSSAEAVSELTITYTKDGFSPETAVIKANGKLTWMNSSDSEIQIGADPHPSHTGNREGTDESFVLTLGPGESKTVTLEKKGTFGYHNHLSPSNSVTIEVK